MVALHRSALCLFALLLVAAGQPAASPWFGTWKLRLKNAAEKPETLVYSDAGRGAMRMVSVEEGSDLVTRFDGKPAAVTKAGSAQGNSLAIRAVTPTSYAWTFSRAGKPDIHGRNTLADDRRSFTEVSWLVTKPERTVTLVYDRQQ